MATPIVPAGLRAAAPALPPRPGRWCAALLLAVAVGAWHAWLVDWLAPPAPAVGALQSGQVQLRTLPLAVTLPPAPATDRPAAAAPAVPAVPRTLPAARVVPATADPALAPPDDAPPVPVPDPRRVALPGAGPGAPASARSATEADPAADAIVALAGQPPPVHATRLPAPARLHYGLRVNGQGGEAQLVWQHDGQRYQLSLEGQNAAGKALWMQASDGVLDAHGLAPERFVDRRAGGPAQAASFRRDPRLPVGEISFSGPSTRHPAWPGAQDRLSWLVQLVAILGAADAPLPALQMFVADARGHAGLWQLQRQPDVQAVTPWGDVLQQHWLREPLQPEALRIELWLPASPDGPAGPWPLRLRMAVPRSGHVVELWRTAAP